MKLNKFPQRLLIGLQDGLCNLSCPQCFVHGVKDKQSIQNIKGIMSFEEAKKIFDELENSNVAVTPNSWTEPLITKDFKKYASYIKEKNLKLVLNTNGLLLDEEMAEFLVKIKTDSVSISIDAFSIQTLQKTRGTDKLEIIKKAVFNILRARGDLNYPRIGVTFVESFINAHEQVPFVNYWIKFVDFIRVTKIYNKDLSINTNDITVKRPACSFLYDTMFINHKGDASICCLDGFYTTNFGNILSSSLETIWKGKEFSKARKWHEEKAFDKIPLCSKCDIWKGDIILKEYIEDEIIIKETVTTKYFNRIDRMNTWKKN